jgi:hypothetical protein
MKASRRHLLLTAFWVVFTIPVLLWWRDSIVLILIISIYANVVGHWSAYEAARAKEVQDDKSP